jgi:hypothetical protein
MMRASSILTALALVAVPGVAMADPDGEARLAKMLDGRTAGTPVACLYNRGIRDTTVIDGTAIVYRSGSTLYVNRPRAGADSLRSDDVQVLQLRGAGLCNTDKIDQVDRDTRNWRGFVLLGDFIPYAKPGAR